MLKAYAQDLIIPLAWSAKNGLRHIFEMHTFTLRESWTSVTLKCRMIALFLKESVFLKPDLAVYVYKVVSSSETLHFHSVFGMNNCSPPTVLSPILDSNTSDSTVQTTEYEYIDGGCQLVFSSDKLAQYALTSMVEKQYKFIHCLNKDKAQDKNSSDRTLICNISLSTLALRLTFKRVGSIIWCSYCCKVES